MSTSGPRAQGPSSAIETWLLPAVMLLVIVALAVIDGAARLALALDGSHRRLAGNPVTLVIDVAQGRTRWPAHASAIAVGLAVALCVVAGTVMTLVGRGRGRHRVDRASRWMGRRSEIAKLSARHAGKTAQRLGVSEPGLMVGRAVPGGQALFSGWEDVCVDIWGPRTGKALAAETPILTPHGWTPIGELARGCRVIGSDGTPTNVTGVFRQGVRPAYRLTTSDGSSLRCDAEHLWTVSRGRRRHQWETVTTAKLLEQPAGSFALPIAGPARLEGRLAIAATAAGNDSANGRHARLNGNGHHRTLDPYVLGVLLGAGRLAGGSITVNLGRATSVAEEMQPLLPASVSTHRQDDGAGQWRITRTAGAPQNRLIAALRDVGLWPVTASEKFIARDYLLAGVSDRRSLLQGLLDSRGRPAPDGCIEVSLSSERLGEDLRFLVWSLGGQMSSARLGDRDRQCVIWMPAGDRPPFRVAAKAAAWRRLAGQRQAPPARLIESIVSDGEAEMVCISVDASDGLFVADGFIVTHNTTSRAIPSILAAPGAALVTSNKRDVVDATRDPRADRDAVWVFDPQQIADEPPGWCWNPLSYVTDETRAAQLADVFASASRDVGAKTDAFFDTAAQNLLTQLLLAAALEATALTQVYEWLSTPTDDTPAEILRDHGYPLLAAGAMSQIHAPDKQRGGVFGTAIEMCAFMTNRAAMRWVVADGDRPEFDPSAFVRSAQTLYSLSKEGKGSCAPLVTALTLAVCEAAEQVAKTSRGGRLPVPIVAVLDEAANVCRWRQLPDLYSHYGSRGICLMTILQSWSQGVDVWGEQGMRKLWSAATVKVYGGGVDEVAFLEDLSRLVGDFDLLTRSESYGQGGRSVSRQTRRERILEVADLASLPKGRIVVLASGSRPTLARSIPWMTSSYADRVRASIAAHDAAGGPPLPGAAR